MDVLVMGCVKTGGAMLRQWHAHGGATFTVADPVASGKPPNVTHIHRPHR